MKTLWLLLLCVCVGHTASGQGAKKLPLKKLSEFRTERERCLYVIDLANTGIFGRAPRWSEVEKIFDLGAKIRTDANGRRFVYAILTDPWPPERMKEAERQHAQAQPVNWYVIFDLDDKTDHIVNFKMSNCHK